jgi:hypothetical protein
MFRHVLLYKFLARVGVAIDAKVTASVVHADVFAYHTTANFTLPFIL